MNICSLFIEQWTDVPWGGDEMWSMILLMSCHVFP